MRKVPFPPKTASLHTDLLVPWVKTDINNSFDRTEDDILREEVEILIEEHQKSTRKELFGDSNFQNV